MSHGSSALSFLTDFHTNFYSGFIPLLTWTRRLFFSDKVLRERTRRLDKEIVKKKEKVGIWRFYTGCAQASLLRTTALDILCSRDKWYRVNKICHTMVQSQQEANQAVLHKGNTGYLKSITEQSHSGLLFIGKSQVPRKQTLVSLMPWCQLQSRLV